MKNVIFTLFAIGLAGLAAIAATTAMLNAPVPGASTRVQHIGPPAQDGKPAGATPPATPPTIPAPPADKPAPTSVPDADKPSPGGAGKPGEKPAESGSEEPEADKDPYEGIAPEDLPPDLQYDADSSVSFPTNT